MTDMTAAELNELVTCPSPGLPDGWPEGARPERLRYDTTRGPEWYDGPLDTDRTVDEAVALHVASAVEWLVDNAPVALMLSRYPGEGFGAQLRAEGGWDTSPTLLHALDAAVRAVGGGG